MSLNHRMAHAHEYFLASLFGGRQSAGSGNQWRNPMDGRTSRKHRRFAFAWDGKSTLGKGVTVTLAMWDKAREQAGGERPMLALRWYATESLHVTRDLVVLDAHDLAEILEAANESLTKEQVIEALTQEFQAADFALVTPRSVLDFLHGWEPSRD